MSRHRQNLGAVGQVTRAMVVSSPSWRMLIRRCSSAESGVLQVWQSPLPESKAQPLGSGAAWAWPIDWVIRSEIFVSSTLPRVATEMVRRTRLIVTASNDGSSASAFATERARHWSSVIRFGWDWLMSSLLTLVSARVLGKTSFGEGSVAAP